MLGVRPSEKQVKIGHLQSNPGDGKNHLLPLSLLAQLTQLVQLLIELFCPESVAWSPSDQRGAGHKLYLFPTGDDDSVKYHRNNFTVLIRIKWQFQRTDELWV